MDSCVGSVGDASPFAGGRRRGNPSLRVVEHGGAPSRTQVATQFVVRGQPLPKGSMDVFTGRPVHRNQTWTRTVHYEALKVWRRRRLPMLKNCGVALELTFYLERGKSVRRALPWVRPDCDKLERAILDGLQGAIMKDDAQVVDLHSRKRYADDGPARVEIVVREVVS